jgi:hypothetical protein
MTGRPKASRQFWLERGKTSFKFVKLLASIALEVMMMGLPGYFISSGIAGNLYGLQPSLLNQRLDVPIDGCLAQSWMVALCTLQNFIRRQRPVSFKEGIADCRLLPCIYLSFHCD